MSRRQFVIAMVVMAVAAAGCGSGDGRHAAASPATSIGPGEGTLTLLAPPGYLEDGDDDPRVDWLTPFTQRTGCKIRVRTAATETQLTSMADSSSYDGVVAPPTLAGTLIDDGAVAPVNTSLLKGYTGITGALRDLPAVERGGTQYGVPDVWSPDLLIYNTRRVKPAPTSWRAVFAPAGSVGKKVTVQNSPLTIADAAMYLRGRRPGLRITDPYELSTAQFSAALAVLGRMRSQVSGYWRQPVDAIEAFAGGAVLGTAGPYQVDVLSRAGRPVAGRVPDEGTTASVDSWLISARASHPNCMYQWLSWAITPEVQAQVAEWLGENPANPDACSRLDRFCSMYHATDSAFIRRTHFAHLPARDCGDRRGSRCVPYSTWVTRWRALVG